MIKGKLPVCLRINSHYVLAWIISKATLKRLSSNKSLRKNLNWSNAMTLQNKNDKKNHEAELFLTLLELQRKNLALSGWAQEKTLRNRVEQMQGEIQEALEEIDQHDAKRTADELGD